VVEYSPHYPKVKGSRTESAAADSDRGKIMKNPDNKSAMVKQW
jgi:hypothetical protein